MTVNLLQPMKRSLLILIASLGLAAMPGARADVILNTYGSPPPGTGDNSWLVETSQWVGRGFTPSQNYHLSSLTVSMTYSSGDRGPITVSVRPDSGGVPSATVLESWVATPSADGLTAFNFTSALTPLLTSGTPYWVVETSVAADNLFRGWTFTSTGATTTLAASFNGGSSWDTYPDLSDVAVRVEGTAVPEPGQWAMMGLTFCGVAGYALRRRRANAL